MGQILPPGDYTVQQPPAPPQPTAVTKIVFAGLQLGSFQTLWGVGRTKPINNPPTHGNVTQQPGTPATFVFEPIPLSGESDNLYCMRQLVTQVDPQILAKATNFTQSMWVQIDNPANCQAFEFDCPTPLNVGTMGIQLLPGKTSWSVRAFDYTIKSWRPLSGTNFDPTLLKAGTTVTAEYACDGKTIEHKNVTINSMKIPVTYSQSCGATLKPRLNAAFQLDAAGDAKAYKVALNNFTLTLQ